jgi:hypothetical protein
MATQALVPKVQRGVGEAGIWAAYDRLYNTYIEQDGRIKKSIRDAGSQKTEVERLTGALAAHKKELGNDITAIAELLGLPPTSHFQVDIIGRIEALNTDHAELKNLKPQAALLQAASDKLTGVIDKLGFGVTKDSDIAGIVGKLVTDNLQFRNNAHEHTLKLAANDTEIARLIAAIARDNTTIDGYMDTVRENNTALGLKDTEIALLKEAIETDKPDTAKLEADLRESKLQATIAESALANSERLIEELNKSSNAVEVTNTELKRQLGDAANARLLTDKAVNVKDDYIAALSKSIVDMNRVLDVILDDKKIEDADSMKIHRPLLVVPGDVLKKSNELVLKTIDAFENDMKYVRNGVVESKQMDVCTKYIDALGQVIFGMRTMSSNFDKLQPADKLKTPLLSATDDASLEPHKNNMLTSVDLFETQLHNIKQRHDLLVGDKAHQGKEITALKGELEAEKKHLNEVNHKVQLAANDLKEEKKDLIARVASAENALQVLQTKYAAETVALSKFVGIVAPPGETPAAGKEKVGGPNALVVRDGADRPDELVTRPLSDMKFDVDSIPASRARTSDRPAEFDYDRALSARSYAPSSSSGTSHQDHVDDRLLLTLLDRLQELVGPEFGSTIKTVRDGSCDAIGMILANALGEQYRFRFMHRIFPSEFPTSKSHEIIGENTVSQYISGHLKDIWYVHVGTEHAESRHDFLERMWPNESSEKKTETPRPRAKSGADTERRRDGIDEFGDITLAPVDGERTGASKTRKASLSTPIANLLIDLKTMHDDM